MTSVRNCLDLRERKEQGMGEIMRKLTNVYFFTKWGNFVQ